MARAIQVTQINKFKSFFVAAMGLSSKALQKIFLKSSRRLQSRQAGWQVVRLSEMFDLSDHKKVIEPAITKALEF